VFVSGRVWTMPIGGKLVLKGQKDKDKKKKK
jgi:hypothetical protein